MRNKTDICQNEIRSVVNARLQPAPTLAVLQRRERLITWKKASDLFGGKAPLYAVAVVEQYKSDDERGCC